MGYGICRFEVWYDEDPYYTANVVLSADFEETEYEDDQLKLTIDWHPQFSSPDIKMSISERLQWRLGVQFGVAYVWSTMPDANKGHLKVYVRDVKGYYGGTRQINIAYATVFALLEALKWKPARIPAFDPEHLTYTFPFGMDENDNNPEVLNPSGKWRINIWTTDEPGIYEKN